MGLGRPLLSGTGAGGTCPLAGSDDFWGSSRALYWVGAGTPASSGPKGCVRLGLWDAFFSLLLEGKFGLFEGLGWVLVNLPSSFPRVAGLSVSGSAWWCWIMRELRVLALPRVSPRLLSDEAAPKGAPVARTAPGSPPRTPRLSPRSW